MDEAESSAQRFRLHQRAPTNLEGMTAARLLTLAEIARDLGLGEITVRNYHQRAERNRRENRVRPGDFPAPDRHFGRTPVWKASTIAHWRAHRPGRGFGGGRPRRETAGG